MSPKKKYSAEEAEIIENSIDNSDKRIVVYSDYDQHFQSPLKRKRIRMSFLDMFIVGFIVFILGFITYKSLESYGTQSRNDIRAGHLAIIREGIEKHIEEGKSLPGAFQEKEIIVNNSILGVQGYAGEAFFSAIGKNVLRDPLDNTYYIYYYQPKGNQYEVMAYLEGTNSLEDSNILDRTLNWFFQSMDYSNRTPYSIGNTGNIILANTGESKGAPINKVITENRIDLSNKSSYEKYLYLGASCKDILTKYPEHRNKDGVRLLLIGDKLTQAYCDMTTDGGGWTLFYANNGYEKSPIKESYVEMREKMGKGGYILSNYADPHLAGLLDIVHFTINGAKEILAKNRVGGAGKWVKFTFNNSDSLAWGLSKDILGKTIHGCYIIPNNGSWSIVNNDEKIKYKELRQIMNHGGTSWGVSHNDYQCNGQSNSASPHIGFYNARNNTLGDRARGNEGTGGRWGEGNEFRYFIR